MSGMMKKITRESKLSLQVDTYDYLGTKCYIETGWATAFNSAPHELLNCSKLDVFVTNQTTKVDTIQVLMMKKTRSILSKMISEPGILLINWLKVLIVKPRLLYGRENREEYFDSNCQRTIDGKSETSKRYDSLVHWAYDERKETI
ncbi:hypothetical protein PPACK8108_LOCUS3080 [Phakopsora pachyrhizi]|uniref:Uncharacterized protein n=1 Tax=Phakopsora pachyrhizi TaxID=170000 RepID=A0AAV0ALT3_PHAPC|nr:hypothetical protein PPACK8108_LOCUS3080 [Phakopsora pachyrhizi]